MHRVLKNTAREGRDAECYKNTAREGRDVRVLLLEIEDEELVEQASLALLLPLRVLLLPARQHGEHLHRVKCKVEFGCGIRRRTGSGNLWRLAGSLELRISRASCR